MSFSKKSKFPFVNGKSMLECMMVFMARLVIPVTYSSANGIPLGAEANPKKRKMLPLDTGLYQRLLGLDLSDIVLSDDLDLINKGAIDEKFVGLEVKKNCILLFAGRSVFLEARIKNSNAEVDFLLQISEDIIPLEVKSGKKGSMRSLHELNSISTP